MTEQQLIERLRLRANLSRPTIRHWLLGRRSAMSRSAWARLEATVAQLNLHAEVAAVRAQYAAEGDA